MSRAWIASKVVVPLSLTNMAFDCSS